MEAHFISTEVDVSWPISSKTSKFTVINPVGYYSAILKSEIWAMPGYKTDFASVPWILQSFVQVNCPHIPAAVIHDVLCDDPAYSHIPQSTKDKIFLEAMGVLDIRFTQQRVMYRGVRIYQTITGWFK